MTESNNTQQLTIQQENAIDLIIIYYSRFCQT